MLSVVGAEFASILVFHVLSKWPDLFQGMEREDGLSAVDPPCVPDHFILCATRVLFPVSTTAEPMAVISSWRAF